MTPYRIILSGLVFVFTILFALMIKTGLYTIVLFPILSFVIVYLLEDKKKAIKICFIIGLIIGIATGIAQFSLVNKGDFQTRTGIWVWSPEENTINRTPICETPNTSTSGYGSISQVCTTPLTIFDGYFYNMSTTFQIINFVLTVVVIILLCLLGGFIYSKPNFINKPSN